MYEVAWRLAGVLTAMVCLLPPLRAAEEAWCMDGRRVRGTLALDKGRLHFTPTEGEGVPFTDITRIRFADRTSPPFRAGGGRRVHLQDGQRITGQFLGLDQDTLSMRTAWAMRIELPRSAVSSVDPLPGWRTLAEDDFCDGLRAFTTTGEPRPTEAGDGKSPRAVVLRAVGQGLVYTPSKPLAAGRVGINFQEQGRASGARWTMEMLFQEGTRSRRVSATVAGEGANYAIDAGGLKGVARSVARTPGWHRLIVSFTKRSLRVTCDEDALWHNLEQGPAGALKQVTIHCHSADASGEALRGGVAWTEFCLERAVDEHPRPPVETEQDEVRLASDDQLFGRILQADRRALQIEGRFGKRSLTWTQVAGCTFRRAVAPPAHHGANVRILLRSGLCSDADVLEGVVTALDERGLILRHALLGELKFERGRVRELRPLTGASK